MSDDHLHAFVVSKDTGDFCKELAVKIATELGESPEAWRGCAELAWLVKSACAADVRTTEEEGKEYLPSDLVVHLLLTLAMLEQFPPWPPDVAGPTLMEVDRDRIE